MKAIQATRNGRLNRFWEGERYKARHVFMGSG